MSLSPCPHSLPSGPNSAPQPGPTNYHPVLCHLIDVGQVARRLWDDVFRPRVRAWVTARLGLADGNAAGAWLAFWAATHDIGKVSPDFQAQGKTDALKTRLAAAGFNLHNPGEKTPHGDVSTAVLAGGNDPGQNWSAVHHPSPGPWPSLSAGTTVFSQPTGTQCTARSGTTAGRPPAANCLRSWPGCLA